MEGMDSSMIDDQRQQHLHQPERPAAAGGTASAVHDTRMMKEPDEFLDSAFSYFKLGRHRPAEPLGQQPTPAGSACNNPHEIGQFRGGANGGDNQLEGSGRPLSGHTLQKCESSLHTACWSSRGGKFQEEPNTASAQAPNKQKKTPFQRYESKLLTACWAARIVGSFYSLSKFLAFCNLTWATVVLLGPFISALRSVDYAMVAFLILLEAIRLASAAFFTILLTHGLARLSQDPKNIIHGKDDHYRRALKARIISSFLQALLISPSIVCPILRFRRIQYEDEHLHIAILIFYIFIITNAVVSLCTLICSSAAFFYLRDRHDQSLLRYYDEVAQNAISSGVVQADDFEFIQFAYKLLGKEYARIVQPDAVVKNHRKLVAYLHDHRLGMDFLLIFLDSDDAFVQQAAVNIVGFWGDPMKKVLNEVKVSQEVLSKMADKVGVGQVGWGAVNSFGALARRDPSILATTRTSSGMPLLDRLAELVEEKSSSLAFVRALVRFYHHSLLEKEPIPLLQHERELVEKLKGLLKSVRVQRLRVQAAYLLHLMGRLDDSCYPLIEAIKPQYDYYWFTSEQSMLDLLIREYDLRLPPTSKPKRLTPDD